MGFWRRSGEEAERGADRRPGAIDECRDERYVSPTDMLGRNGEVWARESKRPDPLGLCVHSQTPLTFAELLIRYCFHH